MSGLTASESTESPVRSTRHRLVGDAHRNDRVIACGVVQVSLLEPDA